MAQVITTILLDDNPKGLRLIGKKGQVPLFCKKCGVVMWGVEMESATILKK